MQFQQQHTVFLVDDHHTVRRGLRELIQQDPDLTVIGEVGSAERALQEIPSTSPDLVIVDLSMDGMGGFELIRRLKSLHPDIPVLVVSIYKNPLSLRQAKESGADGYVSKDLASELLPEAIARVLRGETFFSSRTTKQME